MDFSAATADNKVKIMREKKEFITNIMRHSDSSILSVSSPRND